MSDLLTSQKISTTFQNNLSESPRLDRWNESQIKLSNRHDVNIFWLDPKMTRKEDERQRILEAFDGIPLELFSDFNAAMNRLQKQQETSLLIISGKCAARSLRAIIALRCIDSIIIFCGSPDRYHQLVRQSPFKILACVNGKRELIEKVHGWIDLKCQMHFYTWDKEQNKTRSLLYSNQRLFLVNHVLAELIKNNADPKNMSDMLEYCRGYYGRTKTDLDQIKEFELTYTPSEAISWYTRDSFVHRMVNRGLRSLDRARIEMIAFYMRDLRNQLYQNRLKPGLDIVPCYVYHGLVMTQHDINRIKKLSSESLICMNGFLSTSRQRCIAENFARKKKDRFDRQNLISVLFEIRINLNHSPVVFADINQFSAYPEEEEILFDLGTVFVLNDFYYRPDEKYWILNSSPATVKDFVLIRNSLAEFQSALTSTNLGDLIDQLLSKSETCDSTDHQEDQRDHFSLLTTFHNRFLWSNRSDAYQSNIYDTITYFVKRAFNFFRPDESVIDRNNGEATEQPLIVQDNDRSGYPHHEPVLFFIFQTILKREKEALSSLYSHQYRRFINHHLSPDEVTTNLESFRSIFYISDELPTHMTNNAQIQFYSITLAKDRTDEDAELSNDAFERLNNQILQDLALFYSEEGLNLPDQENNRCIKKCLLNKAAQCYRSIGEVAEMMYRRYASAE